MERRRNSNHEPGFYVRVDTSNVTKEYFEERVHTKISESTCRDKKKIPQFHCGFSSLFVIEEDGTRTSMKVYGLQCKQSDAKELITLLQETYKTDPQFVFQRIRHRDMNAYKNSICKQNSFLAKSCIVPIKGVTMEAMFYVSNEISHIPVVLNTFPHKDLANQGRWNIMTDRTHFKVVSTALETNLANWTRSYCEQENILLGALPPPSLAFKTQPYEEHTDATFSTYMSSFTNMYAIQDNSCNHQPQFNGQSPQSWSPSSTVSYTAMVSISDTSPSQISQEAFEKVTQENAQLSHRVDKLVAQVSALIQQTKCSGEETTPQVHPPRSPLANTLVTNTPKHAPIPPVPSLPPEQVQAIIDKAAAAVLSPIDSSRKRQPTRTTEVLESSTSHFNTMLDTSFDSDTMHHE